MLKQKTYTSLSICRCIITHCFTDLDCFWV